MNVQYDLLYIFYLNYNENKDGNIGCKLFLLFLLLLVLWLLLWIFIIIIIVLCIDNWSVIVIII